MIYGYNAEKDGGWLWTMTTSLGERLKLLIREKRLEQQQVALALGLKTSTFNGYIGDKREPPIEYLEKFAAFFDVSIDYLIGYSDIRNPYMRHMSEELSAFVRDPENLVYIELARDIKARTETKEGNEKNLVGR